MSWRLSKKEGEVVEPNKSPTSEVPIVIPEMTFEQAEIVLKEDREQQSLFIDNVYPWWQTLRWPLLVLSCVFAVLCLSVIFLSVTVKQVTNDRAREYEEDACYDKFTSDSSNATARVRSAATRVDAAGWTALINSANDVDITQQMVDDFEILVQEAYVALEEDSRSIKMRDEWVEAGRPLPCPI